MAQAIWQTRTQLLAVLATFWLYLMIGAFVFSAIERPHADDLHREFLVAAASFMGNNSCVSADSLLEYSNVLINVYSGGLRWTPQHGFNLSESNYQHWDLVDSLFFCATVVTTIGYGHYSPSTALGRSICIAYAFFGIPMTGLLVSLIGDQIKKHLVVLWKRLKARLTCISFGKSTLGRHVTLAAAVIVAAVCFYVVLIIIPACIFYYLEGWDWLTSHYYSFISFTTIGFGDFVAGDSPHLTHAGRAVYKVVLIFYLVLGMGFVAKFLQGLQKRNAERVSRISKRRVIRRIMKRKRRRSPQKIGDRPDSAVSTPSLSSREDEEFVVITILGDGKGEQIEMRDQESEIEYETVSLVEVAIQTMDYFHSNSCTQTEDVHESITEQSVPGCQRENRKSRLKGVSKIPSPFKTSPVSSTTKGPLTWKITENAMYAERTRSRHLSM